MTHRQQPAHVSPDVRAAQDNALNVTLCFLPSQEANAKVGWKMHAKESALLMFTLDDLIMSWQMRCRIVRLGTLQLPI